MPVSLIRAEIDLTAAPGLYEVLIFNSDLQKACSTIYRDDAGRWPVFVRYGFPLLRIDGCRFLECLGNDNKAGRLRNVTIDTWGED